MNLIEMSEFLLTALNDTHERFDKNIAIKSLNDKFSTINPNIKFYFHLSNPSIDQKWVAIAIPKFVNGGVRYADVDINMTLLNREIFSEKQLLVTSVIATIIYKQIFDLDAFNAIQEYSLEISENPLFSNMDYNINESNVFLSLMNFMPKEGILLFAYPDIYAIENEDILNNIRTFKEIAEPIDMYNYRFESAAVKSFQTRLLNYLVSQNFSKTPMVTNKTKEALKPGLTRTFRPNKYSINALTIEVDQMNSVLFKDNNRLSNRFSNILNANEIWKNSMMFGQHLMETSIFSSNRKLNYLEIERQVDLMMSEIDGIKSLSDKQALIDIVYNKIETVSKYISKNNKDKMAQDLLSKLLDVRDVIRHAPVNKRKSIISITYPSGYEG